MIRVESTPSPRCMRGPQRRETKPLRCLLSRQRWRWLGGFRLIGEAAFRNGYQSDTVCLRKLERPALESRGREHDPLLGPDAQDLLMKHLNMLSLDGSGMTLRLDDHDEPKTAPFVSHGRIELVRAVGDSTRSCVLTCKCLISLGKSENSSATNSSNSVGEISAGGYLFIRREHDPRAP